MSHLGLRLEHQVLKVLQEEPLPRGRWLVAVSGGVDSMALAEILWRWRRLLKIELVIAHVHHGRDENVAFRDRAETCVREWCRRHKVKFVHNKQAPSGLDSEAKLRAFRHTALARWQRELSASLLVLAHHRDDLLETQILRLIRGTGVSGLGAMARLRGRVLRPLLTVSRRELEAYAEARRLTWVEDPSNADTDHALRNWVRHEWLPHLETRARGSLKALSRSLALLAENSSDLALKDFVGLRRKAFGQASVRARRAGVAEYLRALGLQGYGRAHVEEIVKRLESEKREFEFTILGCVFRVTPDLVWASLV